MTELTYITTVTQPLSLVLVWSWTVTKRQGSYGDVAHPLPGMNPIYCRLIKKLLSEYRLTTLSLKDIGHQDITKPMQWRVASYSQAISNVVSLLEVYQPVLSTIRELGIMVREWIPGGGILRSRDLI